MALDTTPETPDWWLIRLGRRLRDRQEKQLALWWRYYRGDHPLPEGPKKATEAYRDFQRKARTNFCGMVVRADVHRLEIIGVTDGKGQEDPQAWSWWQQNRMDSRQKQVFRLAGAQSVSYVMGGPHPRDKKRPLLTPEHPREVIVDKDPATGERSAGLKAWYDDISRRGRAIVFTADGLVVRYRTVTERGPGKLPWGEKSWEIIPEGVSTNPYGRVPIIDFPCLPDVGEEPLPAFEQVMEVQDRINLGVLNRMSAERYSAFRQKYVIGHKFRRQTDAETGLEVVEQPFRPDPGSLWASEGKDTKFGEFSQTDLIGYLKTHESDIRDLLVTTSTPAYYIASELVNLSADAVLALDTNHVAKIREYQAQYGEAAEEIFALAAKIAGDERDFSAHEVRWRDPRELNPSVLADMGVKKKAIGYPVSMIAESMGESPQRISRMETERAAEALLAPVAPAAPTASDQVPQ